MTAIASAPLLEVIQWIEGELARGARSLTLTVLDPDHGHGLYSGEPVEFGGRVYVHRPWRVWVELGDRLGLRMGSPRPLAAPLCELRYQLLGPAAAKPEDVLERYGVDSEFARIRKTEEPSFVIDFADALDRVDPQPGARILSLGVNTGDELELLLALRPGLREHVVLVGVDHSPSAIARVRERFADVWHRFVEADLAALPELALGRFDLVLALDVLQSPGVDDRELLRRIVREHLRPTGSLILGLPNCRYRDGELVHGARMKNFSQPDLSLVIADIAHYRRYLHQHHRKVFVTGRHELLITAVPEQRAAHAPPKPVDGER